MRRGMCFGMVAIALAWMQGPVYGALSASSTITPQQLGPNSYEYSLSLTNTGTTPIGTLWFGWIPAYDLLPSAPTRFVAPAGWTGTNAPDFFGVASAQWVNTASPLQPGQTLTGFKFDSPDSPATIDGTSAYFGLPVKESYVYIGAPQTDSGFAFTPTTVVPEPASAALLLAASAGCFIRRRRA
jgi:hypothetical protein